MIDTLLLRLLVIYLIWNRLNGGSRRNWIMDLISRGRQNWDSGSSLIIGLHSYSRHKCKCLAGHVKQRFCALQWAPGQCGGKSAPATRHDLKTTDTESFQHVLYLIEGYAYRARENQIAGQDSDGDEYPRMSKTLMTNSQRALEFSPEDLLKRFYYAISSGLV